MRKVMIVEDEELILQGIKNIVHWNELELQLFHMAHSGQEALEMWKKEPVDIIITDIEMPEMSGLELLKKKSAAKRNLSGLLYLQGMTILNMPGRPFIWMWRIIY